MTGLCPRCGSSGFGCYECTPNLDWDADKRKRCKLPLSKTERIVNIDNNLYERCAEIREWRETGLLVGYALRNLAKEIRQKTQNSISVSEALTMAEQQTAKEAMKLIETIMQKVLK